eukprot:TRINITY_DN4852_c0_g1_i1.p5 TRINITY_DN4852_c0_g1~~TRINITY_DN4852_c0_g1_i1.p5  ORF type:complete len:105 (+),score=1.86 TRINITY_DN4852_c0_g1_i1:391-705(+)
MGHSSEKQTTILPIHRPPPVLFIGWTRLPFLFFFVFGTQQREKGCKAEGAQRKEGRTHHKKEKTAKRAKKKLWEKTNMAKQEKKKKEQKKKRKERGGRRRRERG